MSFNPGAGTFSGSSDVSINSVSDGQLIGYDVATDKYTNRKPEISAINGLENALDTAGQAMSSVEGVKAHDGTEGGGIRPDGYARVRWIGGSTMPTNMAVNDVWEHDA